MMKTNTFITLLAGFMVLSCGQKQEKLVYPKTEKKIVTDTYFGTNVDDPYRWLEDDRSPETEAWVKEENKVTFDYLDQIPYRDALKEQLTAIWNYEKLSSPFKEGEYIYYYKNDGLQNQYVMYRKKGDEGEEELFLDPNTFSEDGTTSLGQVSFSKNGNIAAYSISEGGSDWRKIIIIDAETKEVLEDTLVDVKFSGISWFGNDGFYYSSYDKPEGSELSAKTDQHKLYYHKLGTSQKEDKVVFGEKEKYRYVGGGVTEDDKYLIISGGNSTSGNRLFLKDLTKPNSKIITIDDNIETDTNVADNKGSKLYIVTNLNAPNQRLVTTDASNPTTDNWTDVIPETENVLRITTGADYIFATYIIDAVTKVFQYDYDGKLVREIELPGVGSANGFLGKNDDEVVYFTFTNYSTPSTIYEFNPKEGDYIVYWAPEMDHNADDFESKQVFYTSKDGTKVPMVITYKKGIVLNGKNPTMLYGYGGFNVSLTPGFNAANAIWMNNGGVYAVANLRGGGEYGKAWHDAGTKLQKQNVFDDFIAAAEYLINENYTSSDYLAIRGGSNGGLLVGATMTQRPELMKVVISQVGVLDMLRYHTFTAGAGWAYDYGTAEESEEMFKYLLGYSPLHNVKQGVEYPATIIMTGDHDDRVVPAHSFKFAAELQEKQSGENPVLIRIETNAGHGAGTPISKTIQQYADIYAFTLWNMGIKKLSNP